MNVQHIKRFSSESFETLRSAIDWQQRTVKVYGKEYNQPRLTRWYGDVPYLYSGLRWESSPMPGLLAALSGVVSLVAVAKFNTVLCNLYRGGRDGVGWHADDEPLFGDDPTIASISFGATRAFKLRHNLTKEVTSYDLANGDLLIMGSGVQRDYKHSIPKTELAVGERINLNFRVATD